MKISSFFLVSLTAVLAGVFATDGRGMRQQGGPPTNGNSEMGSENGGGNPNRIPPEVLFKIKGRTNDDTANTGFPAVTGELESLSIGPDLSRLPVIKLQGLKQNPNQPVVFRKIESWKEDIPTVGPNTTETMTYWHGEEAGNGRRSASIVASADGMITGTLTDGEASYIIETIAASDNANPNGSKLLGLTFWAANLVDIPEEADPEEGNENRRLRGNPATAEDVMKVSEDNGESHHHDRELQTTVYVNVHTVYTREVLSYYENVGYGSEYGWAALNRVNYLTLVQANSVLGRTNSNIRLVSGYGPSFSINDQYDDIPSRNAGDFLTALIYSPDFQAARNIRHSYQHDILVVVGENVYTGRASSIGDFYSPTGYYGYAEVKRRLQILEGQMTWLHEIGHLFGARHDKPNDFGCDQTGGCGAYFGNCQRSVMAYPSACPSSCSSCPRTMFSSSNSVVMDRYTPFVNGINGRYTVLPTAQPQPQPTPSPTTITSPEGTCGGGSRGNGVCPDSSLCCSQWGWCGTSPDHCGTSTSTTGTCGGGSRGNGVCADTSLCCSPWGWCGTSSDHCI